MKKVFSIIAMCAFICNVMAQNALILQHQSGDIDAVATSEIESLTFSEDGATVSISANGNVVTVSVSDILSMKYADIPQSLTVIFDGNVANIVNPYFTKGVSAKVTGADVVVDNKNTSEEFSFELTGNTDAGSFLYNGNYKSTFILNGVSITNQNGSAIDIECGKRIAMELKKGTVNTLVDGENGTQKAALYCKGHLEIDKTGTLNVTGNSKHAICAKEYIQLKKSDGKINILGSKSDGIHCGQYFLANGYTVKISNVAGDGIQAEETAMLPYEEDYKDGSICIQGGSFTINCAGENVAGLKADTDITINAVKSNPFINITMTGAGSLGMKAANINKEAGEITIVDSETSM